MKIQNLELGREMDSAENLQWLEMVHQQVASLSYGVVQITIHDGKVVQVEKTEKIRFPHKSQAD